MDALKDFVELIMTPSAPVFIVGALIVLIVPILMHLWVTKSTTYTVLPSVLLTGPSGAGKTALHTLLERRLSPSETHTSQTWSSVELAVSEDGSSSFRDDLDADSLDLYELVMELEDTYGVTVSEQDAAGIETVADAVDFVLQRLPA